MSVTGDTLRIHILGRLLTARNIEPLLYEWLSVRFDHPRLPAPESSYRIEIDRLPKPPAGLDDPRRVVLFADGEDVLLVSYDNHALIGNRRGGIRIDLKSSLATLRIWGDLTAPPLRGLLHYALHEALCRSGLLMLHASCAARSSEATVFLGDGGVGKTTTLLLALKCGWTPVSEDIVWIEMTSRKAYSMETSAGIRPGTVPILGPEFAGRDWGELIDGKHTVAFQQLCEHFGFGDFRPSHGFVERIALLDRDENVSPGTHPVSEKQITLAIWEATGMPLTHNIRARVKDWIKEVVEIVEIVRLRVGNPPVDLDAVLPFAPSLPASPSADR